MLSQVRITSELGDIRQRLIDLTSELVKQETVNPPGNEKLAGDIVLRELKKIGIKPEILEKTEGRPNIIGKIGNSQKGPSLCIACHMDVVPAGDGWATKPFSPTIKGDKLYGRGAADNKGPLAATLLSAEVFKNHETELPGQIIIAAVSDEETGSREGLAWMIDEGLIQADIAIIPDVGMNMRKIDIAEKGIAHLKILSHGKQAHGSTPEHGRNAILALTRLLEVIITKGFPAPPHVHLGQPTVNVGQISGGHAPNMVPAKAEATLDVRYLPSQSIKNIVAQLRDYESEVQKTMSWARFDLKLITDMKPHEVPDGSKLVKAVQAATKEIIGQEARPVGQGGGTFAKFLNLGGIEAIGWGPGDENVFHVANEYIDLSELTDFVPALVMTCLKVLETEQPA